MDSPLVRNAAEATRYYHQDGQGSVVAVTDFAGAVQGTQRFDAYGLQLSATGSIPQYGYTGREPDATGLIYYRARYYDPSVGRFTQRDPLGFVDGVNRYAYAMNSPVNFVDPWGTDSLGSTGVNSDINTNYPVQVPGETLFLEYMNRLPSSAVSSFEEGYEFAGAVQAAQYMLMEKLYPVLDKYVFPKTKEDIDLGFIGATQPLVRALVNSGIVRPIESAAHHIVAIGAKAAAPARAVLKRFGIGIDDAANGVFLPANKSSTNLAENAVHSTIHTRPYYEMVNETLGAASNREQALEALGAVKESLLNGGP